MSELRLSNVCVRYPTRDGSFITALDRINLSIRDGEFVVVLGASGCGKTTLLNLLAGFIAPNEGSITLNSIDISGPGSNRGVVFQKHALMPWLTVLRNVTFGLRMQGVSREERRKTARRYIDLVQLQGFEEQRIYELSGGMQQRVGIARALTADPDVLLMDEPLGALDALTRENIQELVLHIWEKTGKMIFFITHSIEEALFMASRLIIMSPRPGRITREYKLNFNSHFSRGGNARTIKALPDFMEMRKEVTSIILEERNNQ